MKKYLLILALVLILIACKPIKNTNNLVYAVTSPQTAEIICELGKQKQIVAVSNDCNYPPNLKNLPQVGMFANISIEKILNQNPSIVFTAKAVQSKLTTN